VAFEFRWRHRVEFAETDMAGIVHFSNYFRYMEMAEHAFLRSLGLSVHAPNGGATVTWPRVRAECSFKAPLTFEDELEVHLLVRKKTNRTITYDFRLLKEADVLVALGSTTAVCVLLEAEKKQMTAIPIPGWIDEKIEVAPGELLET
jgi:YbgC/YbaW family acyl-CoA thioester hydrolase